MKYKYYGLSISEVEESRKLHGSNDLPMIKADGFFRKLKENFKNPIIIILNVALVLIIILSIFDHTEWYEVLAIAIAVLLAILVSTLSEYKNENSFQKLQHEASNILCNVFRDGKISRVLINEIVKGDYVLLQSGDKVPADCIVIDGEIEVNQASLTGESIEINKTATSKDYSLRKNDFNDPHYIFRGSVVDEGEAIALVDATGNKSLYGQLSKELSLNTERATPLQHKLERLAHLISLFGYIGAGFIALSFMFNKILIENDFNIELIGNYFSNWHYITEDLLNAFVLAIIIIVAAVPEGLPMMIAIVLSLKMRKMLHEKVLVRKLLGIETSGSMDILFSDKTGTITKGKLEPKFIINGNVVRFNSYAKIHEKYKKIIQYSILGNTYCVITPDGKAIGGNITERALINFVDKPERLIENDAYEIINTIRFDSAKKYSATEVKGNQLFIDLFGSDQITFVKGAVEIILNNCTRFVNENGDLQELLNTTSLMSTADKLAEEGVRLIAIGYTDAHITESKRLPENLNLIGFVGIYDEIREESYSAVKKAMDAGIQVVMITGDRKGTAKAIAEEIGLLECDDDLILTSDQLNTYPDDELKRVLPHLKIVARSSPSDKSRLVRIAKSVGRVVGMTGDGVNDSSALKHADIGFAMGSGSEAAKEAGDIVILDDNFSSITNAVRYGRTIFKSIRKFIIYQFTVNLAAILTVFLGPFFGVEFPLTIIQILWINIIMDTLAALALGGEPALQCVMKEKPVKREESIVSKYMTSAILTGGLYIATISLIFLTFPPIKELFVRDGVADNNVFLSAFFNLFIFLIIFNIFNARTEKLNLLDSIQHNPLFIQVTGFIIILQVVFTYTGGSILRTVSMEAIEWFYIIAIAISIIPIDIVRKLIFKASRQHTNRIKAL